MEAKKEIILSILNNKNQSFLASKIHAEICKKGFKNSYRTTKKILEAQKKEKIVNIVVKEMYFTNTMFINNILNILFKQKYDCKTKKKSRLFRQRWCNKF